MSGRYRHHFLSGFHRGAEKDRIDEALNSLPADEEIVSVQVRWESFELFVVTRKAHQ